MADARAKAVHGKLIDTYSRTWFIRDRLNNLKNDVKKGDSVDIPYQSNPTNRTASTRAAPESVTPSVATLSVASEVFFNVAIQSIDAAQYMDGAWVNSTAKQCMTRAGVEMDDDIVEELYGTTAWTTGTDATYHLNAAAAALTDNMVNEAEAAITSNDGVFRQNLAWVVHPYGLAAFKSVADYVPSFGEAELGRLGIPMVTTVNGIPLFVSNSIPRLRTVTCTAGAVSSGTFTLTVAAGHGLVAGQKITLAGGDEDIATATAITSTTATTVVVSSGSATDADITTGGTPIITLHSVCNMLIDTEHTYFAGQILPRLRIVPDAESSGDALQTYAAYGVKGYAGRVYVLNTDPSGL